MQIVLGQVRAGETRTPFDIARSGRLAIVQGPTSFEIQVVDLSASSPQWTSTAARTGWLHGDDISADGQMIVGSSTHNMGDNLFQFPIGGGEPRPISAVRGIRAYPRLSADGRHVAYVAYDADAGMLGVAITTTDGGPERVIKGGAGADSPCGWVGSDRIVICDDKSDPDARRYRGRDT